MARKRYPELPRPEANELDDPGRRSDYERRLEQRRDEAMSDLRGAGDDVLAWYYARARAEASAVVADEREHAAAKALRQEGFSIREIADVMGRPATRVTRLLAGTPDQMRGIWEPVMDHISSALLGSEHGITGVEYRGAHDAAFRRYLPAQGDYAMGHDGQSLTTVFEGRRELLSPNSRLAIVQLDDEDSS